MSVLPACASEGASVPLGDAPTPSEPVPPAEAPVPATPPTPPTPPPPAPFGAEVEKWMWLDVPASKCGNGEPTGMGVNVGTGTDLVIFLNGGGGCWDELSCNLLGTATFVKEGFTKDTFDAMRESLGSSGPIFDRKAPNNPFKDSSFVFVPYCTGDVYAGDAEQQWSFPPRTMHYAGRKNIEAYLELLVPAFSRASRVTFAGSSAGGFGVALNFWRVQDAFGNIRVDMIDDSGPPFEQKDMPLLSNWKSAWKLDGAFPPACTECTTNFSALSAYYAKTYPSSRFSLLSYDHDNVISTFFLSSQDAFATNLRSMVKNRIEPLANMRYFIVPGAQHTMLGNLATKSGDVQIGDWLTWMTTDASTWTNVDNK